MFTVMPPSISPSIYTTKLNPLTDFIICCHISFSSSTIFLISIFFFSIKFYFQKRKHDWPLSQKEKENTHATPNTKTLECLNFFKETIRSFYARAYPTPCFFLRPQLLLNQVEPFHSTTQLLSILWVCAWWEWSCNCGIIFFFF